MKKLTVLISDKGTGSNLQAIIDAQKSGKIDAKIVSVISDTKVAAGLKIAKKNHIPVQISPTKNDLLPILKKIKPDFVVLAGWKQFITDEVIDSFKNKILNLHPGLIPDSLNSQVTNPDGSQGLWNKGLLAEKAVQNFIDQKATYAGSSIHFLTHEFDFGPVLARGIVEVKKGDTVNTLYKRLKEIEHQIYVKALQRVTKTVPHDVTVMVVDGGGRGAALVHAYSNSNHVAKIIAVPGNDLMKINSIKPLKTFPQYKTTDIEQIVKICKKENVDLVDVNQDNAVAVGLVDQLTKNNIQAVGPNKLAGQIEWDKAWSRDFMKKYKIPHPSFKVCKSPKEGSDYINSQKNSSWFIKAAGLASGQGVLPATSNKEALEKIKEIQKFKEAAKTFLIEEWLIGEEISSYAICDGSNFKILGHAQDNKRLEDGDKGPNTGGVGSSSPPLVVTKDIEKQVGDIFKKTLESLNNEGRPYVGVLYLGGMIVGKKVFVIEFNSRWGDPEVEVVLPSIANDLFELNMAAFLGNVNEINIKRDNKYRILVTACAKGYPYDLSKSTGKQIYGINNALKLKNITIYSSGVKEKNGKHFVSGGRMFHIVAEGRDVLEARKNAYNAIKLISVEGDNLHYRTDIGFRDLNRLNKK